jgi:hypothetical protein
MILAAPSLPDVATVERIKRLHYLCVFVKKCFLSALFWTAVVYYRTIVFMLPHTFEYIFPVLTFLFLSSPAFSQIPFYTDDADTTPKGKFHIEFFTGFTACFRNRLLSELLPG